MKDLTVSPIDRQNILNNNEAIENIQSYIGVIGIFFNNEFVFTKQQISEFYCIDTSTVDRYLSNHENELKNNGYKNLKGTLLKNFKEEFKNVLNEEIKAPQLGVFNFRSFLNLGMLLTESEKAKALRHAILNVVIDTIDSKIGGSTKYINQRDDNFLLAITREPAYRKEFTQALNAYLEMGNYKYAVYTDAIYKVIFKENANEYKQILKLEEKENPRDTMYAEVLSLIASFEIGLADEMKIKSEELNRKLTPHELDILIENFSSKRHWIPLIEDARSKMACRDYGFRNIIHTKLENYIGSVSSDDHEKFIGKKSNELIQKIVENPDLLDVFKRLKDR